MSDHDIKHETSPVDDMESNITAPGPDRESRIRKHILLPLAVALLISAAITVFASQRIHQLHLAREADQRLRMVDNLLPALLDKDAVILAAQIAGLTTCPLFPGTLLSGDRAALLARVAPFYSELSARHDIIELSFIEPDGTILLHLGQAAGISDHHPGHDARGEAILSAQPVHGLELDAAGVLSLRMIRPLRIDNQLAGFIDLRREVPELAANLSQAMGSDIWLTAPKKKLDPERWQQRTGPELAADWERFSEAVIISGSRADIPPVFTAFIERLHDKQPEKFFSISSSNLALQGGYAPLFDAGGREIGSIFLLEDASALVAAQSRLRLKFLGGLGFTAAGVFAFLYFFLGRIQARLSSGRSALLAEIDNRRQVEAALRGLKEGLELQVTERTSALTAANLALQKEIDERRQAETELRHARDEWEQTFNAMSDVVTLQDQNLRITRANRAAGEVLGMSTEELIGIHCYQVFRGADEPCADCPEPLSLLNRRPYAREIEHPNLGRTFLVSASPIIGSDGSCRGLVHVARDVTTQKKFEAQLQQSRKMEAVGILAAGVAHDFNNILTGILGYGELILQEAATDSILRQDIDQIIELGRRGAGLTRQLLAFSRNQPLDASLLDLNDLTANLMKLLSRLLGEDIKIEFKPAPDLDLIKADHGQMEQVIINLAVNGRDAMPNGGTLSIETGNIELDAGHEKTHPGITAGPHVMLTVSDTGTGMDQDTLEHIFEPFFTTKEIGRGTGLGLATLYGIVQQHNGCILAASQTGQGTVFKIFLPRALEQMPEQAAQEKRILSRGKETILLAEDEESVRAILCRTLEEQGYTVLTAASPAEAEEILADRKEAIDLLFTDIIMPGGNGMELYRRLAADRPDLKVLFMSGYNETVMEQKKMELGEMPFIQKPFSAFKITRAVRRVLDG